MNFMIEESRWIRLHETHFSEHILVPIAMQSLSIFHASEDGLRRTPGFPHWP